MNSELDPQVSEVGLDAAVNATSEVSVLGPAELIQVDLGLLHAVADAAVVADSGGRITFVNKAAARLMGVRSEALLGRWLPEVLFSELDRDGFREVSEQVLLGQAWRGELAMMRGDGSVAFVGVSCAPVRSAGRVIGLVCVLTELGSANHRVHSAQRLAERLTGLAKVAAELAGAEDLATVTDVVISEAARTVGATVGSLSLLVDPDTLVLAGLRGARQEVASRWRRYSVHEATPAGDVARSGEPLVLVGLEAIRERYPDLGRAAEGERSMVALPLRMTGRTIGVMTWSFPGRRRFDVAEMEFYGVLADSCAQAVERIRAEEESQRQAARVQFLADATSKLSESLDYQSTLAEVARMAVPVFADWCAIDLIDDGRLHRLAVEHVDPAKVALAVELEERYPARSQDSGAWTVIRTGEPLLVPEVTDEMVAQGARDEEHHRLVVQLQLRSVLLVPLVARGVVLGVMTWVMAESDRRYRETDVDFATDLGRRAAIAIDNSRLHTDTLEAAVRLQHAVLPELPGAVPGWEIASHYTPAGRTEVGGDFFDVVPLADDSVAMFVGDVMGRGVRAAAAMAQMRAAVRAYIAVDPDPTLVVSKLDGLFATYRLGRLVTMVYLLTNGPTVSMVNAGHPAPVVRRGFGRAEQLPSASGPPLGMETGARAGVSFAMAESDILVMFTDGLIERRGEDIGLGQRRVLDALAALEDGPLDQMVETLATRVHDPTRNDDVAVLAARRLAATRTVSS